MALVEVERTARRSGSDTALRDWLRALEATAPIAGNPQRLLPGIIEELAQTRGDAPALLSARECLTYAALAARANRFARWALDQNLAKGETVCLMMPNRPEYMAIWLGLTSVGVAVSLLNTRLSGRSLAHCIDVVAPKHVIVDAALSEQFCSAAADVPGRANIWSHGGGQWERIDRVVDDFSSERLTAAERRAVTVADRALLIFTSGTTGRPKAANVSHQRLLQWSLWFAGLMNTAPEDRMYDCLPMYHSVGGVVAPGSVLVRGGSVLIREKFSARQFWDDIVDWNCTLVQYIGELARYLVNAPENPRERAHRLRLCCGNGLRAELWETLQMRFRIPRILEFYAATEGNVALYNVEGKVGSIGRVPSFLAHRFPLALVKFDAATGEPARDRKTGLCIRCAANEAGEALGRIGDGSTRPGGAFEGYAGAEDTERKILRDVFVRGDAWYRTGDLMRMDAGGFFYFVDRIGDTFRWKGENVATSEVAAAIAAFPGVKEANIYGVRVPGTEGAAGMAAIVIDRPLDFAKLRRHLTRTLPPYARPLFLRITDEIAATATFKPANSALKTQGYDPAASKDAIYFDDASEQAFVRLDNALYARIQAGEVHV